MRHAREHRVHARGDEQRGDRQDRDARHETECQQPRAHEPESTAPAVAKDAVEPVLQLGKVASRPRA
jgi:hypothetical protein